MVLRPGEPLPPVRQLIESCGTSRARLEGLLAELSAEGLIERRPRQGIFKAAGAAGGSLVSMVDLVACGRTGDVRTEGTFSAELLEAVTTQASRRGMGVRLHQFWVGDRLADYEALAVRSDVRACLLLGLHIPELATLLNDQHIAWVSIFPQTQFALSRTVLDSPRIPEIHLRHLWGLGHRRIASLDRLNEQAPSRAHRIRREAFYRLMAERGLRVAPHWVANGWFDEAACLAALEGIFSEPPHPTAIVAYDPHLSTIYRFLERRGLKIAEDVSVIGTDDLAITATLHPPATTVRNSRRIAAEIAMDMLDRILAGQEVNENREVPVELVVRQSTGRVRNC